MLLELRIRYYGDLGKISKADQKVKAGMVYSCKTLDFVPVLLKQGHPTTVFCKYLFGEADIT